MCLTSSAKLSINTLYISAIKGNPKDEEKLFQELSVRFRHFLYQKIRDEGDAEEILQEAMMKISKEYKSIEFSISFSAWAYNVLKNQIRNYRRSKQHKINCVELQEDDNYAFNNWEPDPLFEDRLIKCFREISKYNKDYARVLNLKYQGFSVEEICAKMNITPNNLYVILSRARSILRLCVDKGGAE
jgi:RNA polymerase sigma-70 factor (ECF subfamily)